MLYNNTLAINEDVRWIGIMDENLVTFDVVMETKYGTTYNSYFINADKPAIIDTVKEDFWTNYEVKIRNVCDPAEIEYIILNHSEPDHSGSVAKLLSIAPKATVVGSGNAIRYLSDMFDFDMKTIIVREGDMIDLGNKKLRFISAPNLHWPDTMYTYLEEDQLLFTCDSFGSHYCHEGMFDDKVGNFDEAFKYYFEVILRPFSRFMLKAIGKIEQLEIKAICPGHGPILRSNWKQIVETTKRMSEEYLHLPDRKRVFIPYVSAYHKTGRIAEKIAEGIESVGDFEVDICDIEHMSLGELEQKVIQSSALIVGSPTINQNILLPIYKLFSVINPLRDHGKIAGGFGSFGWSGENAKLIESGLKGLKLKYFGNGVFIKFTPNNTDLDKCYTYGQEIAKEISN